MELQEKEFFMREALKEAQKAYDQAEVPIGAVVVLNGEIIGRGHNLREKEQDATLHAEIKSDFAKPTSTLEAGDSKTANSSSPWNLAQCVAER